jgi:hypothetical protein
MKSLFEALLLDGGGLGRGVAARSVERLGKATAPNSALPPPPRHTTIPGPSSIEEEGKRATSRVRLMFWDQKAVCVPSFAAISSTRPLPTPVESAAPLIQCLNDGYATSMIPLSWYLDINPSI